MLLDSELASLVVYFVIYFRFYFKFYFEIYFGWYELVVLETEVLRSLLLLQLVGEVSRVLLLFVFNPATNQDYKSFSFKSNGINHVLRGASLVLGVNFQQEDYSN